MLYLSLLALGLILSPVPSAQLSDEETIERGRYLSVVTGCTTCHTPQENGVLLEDKLLTGHPQGTAPPQWDPSLSDKSIGHVTHSKGTAFAGPWGTSYAGNLTPDPNTGIGSWNEAMFIRTMRRGEFNPPMPVHLKNLSRSDLKAIWAYLQSLEPVYNGVPRFQPR